MRRSGTAGRTDASEAGAAALTQTIMGGAVNVKSGVGDLLAGLLDSLQSAHKSSFGQRRPTAARDILRVATFHARRSTATWRSQNESFVSRLLEKESFS